MCTHPKLFYLHPLFSPLCLHCHLFCLLRIYAAARSSCFFSPPLSVILCFFAGSPLPNFMATLPPPALTMDTGAFNVGQWNKSERLPGPTHCIHPRALFSFSSFDFRRAVSSNVTWATQKIGHFTSGAPMASIFEALLQLLLELNQGFHSVQAIFVHRPVNQRPSQPVCQP